MLEEKPIAPTIELATEALKQYRALEPRPVWAIAENYRFEASFWAVSGVAQPLATGAGPC